MAVKSHIVNGSGKRVAATVNDDRALYVTHIPLRLGTVSAELLTAQKVLFTRMTNDAGSADMNVNGSVTNQSFYIPSQPDRTYVVNSFRFVLNDENMTISSNESRRFGSASGSDLPNGITFSVNQGGITTNLFINPVQTIGDFLFYVDEYDNLPDSVAAGVDLLTFDFHMPVPIILPIGSQDNVVLTVRDNLSTLNFFQVYVKGYQELRM